MASTSDLVWFVGRLRRRERWRWLGTRGATVWFTGLSGSGKSTLAAGVEERLVSTGRGAYRLDGDNLRSGLNADLDFSRAGREENVRRVAEVARLFADAGVIALAALISPYAEGRRWARTLHEDAGLRFIEVYMATPLSVCAERDPKGFYARASTGDMASFTGMDDPYEPPEDPDLVLGHHLPLADAVDQVIAALDMAEPPVPH
ncbi:MAG TPA: adenylyl-sulfate kinase [Acidimicrobiales bacterium]|nr:adenylyl-sulfate kinase [Acidimicrobiales bacterium]